MSQFRYPPASIQQNQYDGVVTIALRGSGIYYAKQFLNLGVIEGRDNFPGWSWDLYPVKGVVLDYILRDKP